MTDWKLDIDIHENVFDDNKQVRKMWSCLGQPCSRSLIVFCLNFLSFCWLSSVAFGEFTFHKLVMNQNFRWVFCVVEQAIFYPHENCEQVFSSEKMRLFFIGRSVHGGKVIVY